MRERERERERERQREIVCLISLHVLSPVELYDPML